MSDIRASLLLAPDMIDAAVMPDCRMTSSQLIAQLLFRRSRSNRRLLIVEYTQETAFYYFAAR